MCALSCACACFLQCVRLCVVCVCVRACVRGVCICIDQFVYVHLCVAGEARLSRITVIIDSSSPRCGVMFLLAKG